MFVSPIICFLEFSRSTSRLHIGQAQNKTAPACKRFLEWAERANNMQRYFHVVFRKLERHLIFSFKHQEGVLPHLNISTSLCGWKGCFRFGATEFGAWVHGQSSWPGVEKSAVTWSWQLCRQPTTVCYQVLISGSVGVCFNLLFQGFSFNVWFLGQIPHLVLQIDFSPERAAQPLDRVMMLAEVRWWTSMDEGNLSSDSLHSLIRANSWIKMCSLVAVESALSLPISVRTCVHQDRMTGLRLHQQVVFSVAWILHQISRSRQSQLLFATQHHLLCSDKSHSIKQSSSSCLFSVVSVSTSMLAWHYQIEGGWNWWELESLFLFVGKDISCLIKCLLRLV